MNHIKIFKKYLDDPDYPRHNLSWYEIHYEMNMFDRVIMTLLLTCYLVFIVLKFVAYICLFITTPLWIIPYLIFNIFRKEK